MRLLKIATITTGYCQRKNTGKALQTVSLVQARDFDSCFADLTKTNIPVKYSSFLKSGDVLVKARGAKFEAKVFKTCNNTPAVASNTLLVVRITDDDYLSGYIAQIINTSAVQKYLRSASSGALLSSLSPSTLAEVDIGKIPLAKQRQICEAVEAIEDYRSALDRCRRLEDSLLNSLTSKLMKGVTNGTNPR